MIEILDVWCLICGHSPLVKINGPEDRYLCEECETVQTKEDHGL